jgi:hypothetical protein
MSRCHKRPLPIRIPNQSFVCISHNSHVRYVPTLRVLFDVITPIFVEEYKL